MTTSIPCQKYVIYIFYYTIVTFLITEKGSLYRRSLPLLANIAMKKDYITDNLACHLFHDCRVMYAEISIFRNGHCQDTGKSLVNNRFFLLTFFRSMIFL